MLIIILFISSANISEADTNKLNFNNKEINELIKNNKLNDIIPKQEKEFDISKYTQALKNYVSRKRRFGGD